MNQNEFLPQNRGSVFTAIVVILFIVTLIGLCGLLYWEKEKVTQTLTSEVEGLQQERKTLKESIRKVENEKEKAILTARELEIKYLALDENYRKLEKNFQESLQLKEFMMKQFTEYTAISKQGWAKIENLTSKLGEQLSEGAITINDSDVQLPPVVVKKKDKIEVKQKEEEPKEEIVPTVARKIASAQIMSINHDHNFVVINKGLVDGLRIGDMFEATKKGKQVATIKISEIRDFVSLGLVLEKDATALLKEGDVVKSL